GGRPAGRRRDRRGGAQRCARDPRRPAAVVQVTRSVSMKLGWQPRKWLAKKAKAGNRGFPLGTVAFYGPDDRRASKVAVGVMMGTDDDPVVMRRWFSQDGDVREDEAIGAELASLLRGQG